MAFARTVPIMSPKFPEGTEAINGSPLFSILEYAKKGYTA
jgi:hypothetical protein